VNVPGVFWGAALLSMHPSVDPSHISTLQAATWYITSTSSNITGKKLLCKCFILPWC
jgi:hypothetical protein